MTTFLAANLVDSAVTWAALNSDRGFEEVGILGSRMAENDLSTAIVVKMAVTALIIGSFALAKSDRSIHRHKQGPVDFEYVYTKTMSVGTAIVFLVVVLNVLQYAKA